MTAIGLPASDQTVAKRIGQYKAIEAKLDAMDKANDLAKAPLLEIKAMLQGYFEQVLTQTGAQNIATPLGTVHWNIRTTASLEDAEAFMNFVTSTAQFELMDRRANATACRDYAEKGGSLPPGVKLSTIRTIGVNKPAAKHAKK